MVERAVQSDEAIVMDGVAISRDGVPIHYEVHGEGEPALVFVHGWSCDQGYWSKQASELARHLTVVTVDLAGHGKSGLERTSWTMSAFGEDVVAVVEQLDLKQVILVGHSMGGSVIVEAARRLPQRVIGLIALETFQNVARTRTPEEVDAIMAPFRDDFARTVREFVLANQFVATSDPELVETVIGDMAAAPPDVGIAAATSLFGNDANLREGLLELKMPVALINSDHRPTNIDAARQYDIQVEFVSGASHFLMFEVPETINRRLLELVAEFSA